jgi:hypothetical protein
MAAPQLSVRSARARDLAHSLSKQEGRPIHVVVEDALTAYAARKGQVSFKEFLGKLQAHTWPEEEGEISLDDLMAELDTPQTEPRL